MFKYAISCDFVTISKKDDGLYQVEQYLPVSTGSYVEEQIFEFDEAFKVYCQKIENSKLFQRNKFEGFFYSLHKISIDDNDLIDEILQDSLDNYLIELNKYFN